MEFFTNAQILWNGERYLLGGVNMAKNRTLNPRAKTALNHMKQEVAREIGVDLKEGYNGDMTSHDAGRIGGSMVKKMIQYAEDHMSQNER